MVPLEKRRQKEATEVINFVFFKIKPNKKSLLRQKKIILILKIPITRRKNTFNNILENIREGLQKQIVT